eukprot:gene16816-biopygen4192
MGILGPMKKNEEQQRGDLLASGRPVAIPGRSARNPPQNLAAPRPGRSRAATTKVRRARVGAEQYEQVGNIWSTAVRDTAGTVESQWETGLGH